MSENMRSIVVYGAKDVKIENFPVPECDDDKILPDEEPACRTLWQDHLLSLLPPGTRLVSKGTSIYPSGFRSEERRVGKECRSRWSPYH